MLSKEGCEVEGLWLGWERIVDQDGLLGILLFEDKSFVD